MCLFKENIAIRYGVNAAIVAQFLWDNLDPQSNSGRLRFFSDEKWCRCSILMIGAHYPFLTRSMVENALNVLVRSYVLKKGCFNENRFDKTNWYAFTEFGQYLMRKEGESMKVQCEECRYYDIRSGLCGFCMKKIIREVEERKNGNRQDSDENTQ